VHFLHTRDEISYFVITENHIMPGTCWYIT